MALVFPEEESEILDLDQYRDQHMQCSDDENGAKDINDIEKDVKENNEEINEEEDL